MTAVGIFQPMSQLEDGGYQKQANQADFVRELEASALPCLTADRQSGCAGIEAAAGLKEGFREG